MLRGLLQHRQLHHRLTVPAVSSFSSSRGTGVLLLVPTPSLSFAHSRALAAAGAVRLGEVRMSYYSEAPSGSDGLGKSAKARGSGGGTTSAINSAPSADSAPRIRVLQGPSEDPSKAIVWQLDDTGSRFVKEEAGHAGSSPSLVRSLRKLPVETAASVTAYLLPYGYPRTVSPSYRPYASWAFMGMLFSSISGVLSTQSLLYAIGVGAGSVPIAAALNWVLKDGLGQLGGVLSAALINNRFDSDPKRWRFISAVAQDASTFLEILTPLMPQAFLPLAAVANVGKNISWLSASATRAGIHNSLAIRGNLADVTAKAGSQTITASTIGMLCGVVLSPVIGSDPKHILVAFLVCSFLHLTSVFQSLRRVVLPTLSARRLAIATSPFFTLVQQLEEQQQRDRGVSGTTNGATGSSTAAAASSAIEDWAAIPLPLSSASSASSAAVVARSVDAPPSFLAGSSDESVGEKEAIRLVELSIKSEEEGARLLSNVATTTAAASSPSSSASHDLPQGIAGQLYPGPDDGEDDFDGGSLDRRNNNGSNSNHGADDDEAQQLQRAARHRVLGPSEVGKLERFAPLIGGLLEKFSDGAASLWHWARRNKATATAAAPANGSSPSLAPASTSPSQSSSLRSRTGSADSVTSNQHQTQSRSFLPSGVAEHSASASASAAEQSAALRRVLSSAAVVGGKRPLELDLLASEMIDIGPALGKAKGFLASCSAKVFGGRNAGSQVEAAKGTSGLGSSLFAFAEASGAIPSAAVALAGGPVTGAAVVSAVVGGGGASAFIADAAAASARDSVELGLGSLAGIGPNTSKYVVAVKRGPGNAATPPPRPRVQVLYTHDATWRDCLVAYLHAHFVARSLLISQHQQEQQQHRQAKNNDSAAVVLSRDLELVRAGLAFASAYGDRLIQDLEVSGWWVGQPLLERDYNKRLRWSTGTGSNGDGENETGKRQADVGSARV